MTLCMTFNFPAVMNITFPLQFYYFSWGSCILASPIFNIVSQKFQVAA